VAAELAPRAAGYVRDEWFPNDVFVRCGKEGYLGLKYEERYGGTGGGYLADAVWAEELARAGSGGLAAGIGAHTSIATPPIWRIGTEGHKQRYRAPAIKGEKIGALAITEPDAGSDVAGLKTRAERVDGGFVVNGEKTYITNACARTSSSPRSRPPRRAATRAVVPGHRPRPGREVEQAENARLARLGQRDDRLLRRLRARHPAPG
jgi:alkylation response protein AidB-like acyl-CoA dehydrogenase